MRTCYLLDTGPLFDFLTIDHCKKLGAPWENSGGILHLTTEVRFAKFSEFADENGPFLTVPGVLAEVGGLFEGRRGKPLFGSTGFWSSALEHLTGAEPLIEDHFVRAGDLQVEVVREFGPVDASLCSVAKKLAGEHRHAKVVTGDRKLWGSMQGKISMTWIDEILFA